MTDSTHVRIEGYESIIFAVTGAGHLELNRIDTAVRSCGAVMKKPSGWIGTRVTDDSFTYLIVFERGIHSKQHMLRIEELIKAAVPGINIHFN